MKSSYHGRAGLHPKVLQSRKKLIEKQRRKKLIERQTESILERFRCNAR
jgi:hypothetical protein